MKRLKRCIIHTFIPFILMINYCDMQSHNTFEQQYSASIKYQTSPLIFNGSARDLLREKIRNLNTPSYLQSGINKVVRYFKSFFDKKKSSQEMGIEKTINNIAKKNDIYLNTVEKEYITKTLLGLRSLKTKDQQNKYLKTKENLYPDISDVDFGEVQNPKTIVLAEETLSGHARAQKMFERYFERYDNKDSQISDDKEQHSTSEDLTKINKELTALNNNIHFIIDKYLQQQNLLKSIVNSKALLSKKYRQDVLTSNHSSFSLLYKKE